MPNMPQRPLSHVVDSIGCNFVSELMIEEGWVARDLSERDYGIDKIYERFEDERATSELIVAQIKTIEKPIGGRREIPFSLDTKTLLYAEMFAVPFLLFYCSVSDSRACYFVWLQEYIRIRLNYEKPGWRNQGTNTIYIPNANALGDDKAMKHLCFIASFPKFKESWANYYISLADLMYDLPMHIVEDEIDESYVRSVVAGAIKKLDRASAARSSIPDFLIPQELDSAKRLGENILNGDCDNDLAHSLFRFVGECNYVRNSIDLIALNFDDSYQRFLYEAGKPAMY